MAGEVISYLVVLRLIAEELKEITAHLSASPMYLSKQEEFLPNIIDSCLLTGIID